MVSDGAELSYGNLTGRANRLARLLIAGGCGPESLVAVVMERSADLVVALLAVVKAGGAYLPVDTGYPADRISYMLTDASAALVLTSGQIAERLTPTANRAAVPLLTLDDPALATALAALPTGPLTDSERRDPLLPQHPAYIIYTSGSTGRPKGAVVTHAGAVNLVAAQVDRFATGPGSRVLQFASIGFDVSVWDLLLALWSGASLVVVAADELQPGAGLAETITRHQVTHATLAPAVLAAMEPEDLASLPTLVSAGEALSGEQVAPGGLGIGSSSTATARRRRR